MPDTTSETTSEMTSDTTSRPAPVPDAELATELRQPHHQPSPATADWQFPGCRPIHLTREGLVDYEGRLEFWDARLETAWVMEPPSPYHESPSQNLAALVDRIAAVRGSPIRCFGTMGLVLLDEHGERWRVLQADQAVYLHPTQENLPGQEALVIGEHAWPDVVVEVDYSTDARRSKLGLYASWGFPEVWLEVPDRRPSSRPRKRVSGLTIYRLAGDAWRVSEESGAFPGWRAEEIHAAMNERVLSKETCAVLERVGMALGSREGTGPDDDPLLRSHGRREYERGRLEARTEARFTMVREMLRARGIELSDGFPADLLAECTEEAIVAAVLGCESEADFLARLQRGSSRS